MGVVRTPDARARRRGGLLLWFTAFGGAAAWSAHALAAWSIDELTCATGRRDIAGVPLGIALVCATVAPAAVTVVALALAWRAWRRTSAGARSGDRGVERAQMVALIGLWSNALFLTIILLGAAAVMVFPPC
ncbi:hypothetical protein [Micromonospora sp. NPDC049679]|uniref:hypothetical protein n=1 Tax=Micromonospora sp. NPDC049679 TaxID=3155920 RepID=UPI0033F2D03E